VSRSDIKKVDKFDPSTVPTVKSLVNQIHEFDTRNSSSGDQNATQNYAKTDLKDCIKLFEVFLNGLTADNRDVRLKVNDLNSAIAVDF